jgi:hypothetical protein
MNAPDRDLKDIKEIIARANQDLFPADAAALFVAEFVIKCNNTELMSKDPCSHILHYYQYD